MITRFKCKDNQKKDESRVISLFTDVYRHGSAYNNKSQIEKLCFLMSNAFGTSANFPVPRFSSNHCVWYSLGKTLSIALRYNFTFE